MAFAQLWGLPLVKVSAQSDFGIQKVQRNGPIIGYVRISDNPLKQLQGEI